MRHRVKGKKLSRSSNHRKALFKNQLSALIEHGQITTTKPKAKVLKRLSDKIITQAKKRTLNSRRLVHAYLNRTTTTNKLVDLIAPTFKHRTSGYTRITTLPPRRGDNAVLAKLEFVDKIITPESKIKGKSKKGKSTENKKPITKTQK